MVVGADCFDDCARARHGCDTGNVVLESGLANLLFVAMGNTAQEARDLIEEGMDVAPLPPDPDAAN